MSVEALPADGKVLRAFNWTTVSGLALGIKEVEPLEALQEIADLMEANGGEPFEVSHNGHGGYRVPSYTSIHFVGDDHRITFEFQEG